MLTKQRLWIIAIYTMNTYSFGRFLGILDANLDLRAKIALTAMPQTKVLRMPLPDSPRTDARVRLLLPPGLREEEEFVFPLVVNV